MNWQRNTSGLQAAAQKKRLAALARVDAGIKQLLRQGHPISFESVAEVASVSRSWLYKQPELKQQIMQLRESKPVRSSASSADAPGTSKEAIILALRQQLKALKQETETLKQQLEVAYGLAYGNSAIGLTTENQQLTEALDQTQTMLAQSVQENQGLAEKNRQLKATQKELQGKLIGMESMEIELAELRRQNQHLFNKVVQLESVERIKAKEEFASARQLGQTQPELPEVEF